jgi:hypothetical protein
MNKIAADREIAGLPSRQVAELVRQLKERLERGTACQICRKKTATEFEHVGARVTFIMCDVCFNKRNRGR